MTQTPNLVPYQVKDHPPSPSASTTNYLTIHLQESNYNQGLDNSTIDKLSEFKFDYPKSLHHFVKNITGISWIIFYGDSVIFLSLGTWIDHFDKRELLYDIQFDSDVLFSFKVYLTIERSVQLFLQSCQDATSIDDVNFKYLDFTFDQESIERHATPPPPSLNYSKQPPPEVTKTTQTENLRNRNALSGIGGSSEENESLVTNPDKNHDWILNDKECYNRAFP